MTDAPSCPRCGSPLPPDAPEGSCPRCLLAAGLAPTEPHDEPVAVPGPKELARHFPELEIEAPLGRGGMGVVYRARQTRLDRIVALKILSPRFASDPAFEERFAREARALARLSHPNIVAVHDFGQKGGFFYLLMEFVDGTNLRQALQGGHLTPEQALAIVPKICDALQFAHDRGVVHRDIKPENVLLTKDGEVKIADFGLAKLGGAKPGELTLTAAGQVMGTPHYMAPEQFENPQSVDHRADIYSLGVVFYEMLTGELPLGRFAPPSRKVHVDVRLDDVVLKTLEKEPGLRYQRVDEVKTEVNSVAEDPQMTAAPATATQGLSVPATGRKLSNLALYGALCFPLSILVFLLPMMLLSLLSPGATGTWREPGVLTIAGMTTSFFSLLPSAIIGLTGVILSLSGWVVIARSGGRLDGLWLAVPGTLLPFMCGGPLLALTLLFLARTGPFVYTLF